MEPKQNLITKKGNTGFGLSHVMLLAGCAAALGTVLWVKDPVKFSLHAPQAAAAKKSDVPHYYAYVPPAQSGAGQVAGATAIAAGPAVIGDDGTVRPISSSGEVLGVSTTLAAPAAKLADLNTAKSFSVVDDATVSAADYVAQSMGIENNYFDTYTFEDALQSAVPAKAQAEIAAMQKIVQGLKGMQVPKEFSDYHQDKITRYQAAMELLAQATVQPQHPTELAGALKAFISAQEKLDRDFQAISQIYNAAS